MIAKLFRPTDILLAHALPPSLLPAPLSVSLSLSGLTTCIDVNSKIA